MQSYARVVLVSKEFEGGQAHRVTARLKETLQCQRVDLVAPSRKGSVSIPTLGAGDLLVLCIRGLPHTTSDTVMHEGRTGAATFVVVRRFSLSLDREVLAEIERRRTRLDTRRS
jgi:hypothetical protein